MIVKDKSKSNILMKSQLGQFYTTNYDYILQNMNIPTTEKHIIEPFAGNGDLLNFINVNNRHQTIELYDIDPKCDNTDQRDTLKLPPSYDGKFVVTNPPYLARNKNKDKSLYDKYNCNDLYKCFIISLLNSKLNGGIIIIPLNFLSSIRKADIELRKKFIEKFKIITINIFEERVFDDTSYSVCSIQFTKKNKQNNEIKIYIYPSNKTMDISLSSENNYTIGGEIYLLEQNSELHVERATKLNKDKDFITNIMVKCIDDNINSRLGFQITSDDNRFIDNTEKLSARSYATLIINKKLSLDEQHRLVEKMNSFIDEKRHLYNSLFLTNYRESNSIARKRISFDLAFKICNYILSLYF
uniref:Type II methyltransferase M.TaqI-like domain-containing protein n=1 Tax=Megaviridae environmental sample TaxID=1737588 RepID=A0A5J6VJJ0_9VIRU|nr:MAG: hypothetical protein [Megaviridae environmental sample]